MAHEELGSEKYVLIANRSSECGYELVTLAPTYRQTSSYLFRWFRNMQSSCTRENAPEKMAAMISAFDLCKDELLVSLRLYLFVEGMLLTSYRLRIEDSRLICEVLNVMSRCWSSFGPLHFKAVMGGQKGGRGRRSPEFLSFFLEHARRRRLAYDGVRMIDVSVYSQTHKAPVFLAADAWRWKQVLTYLQYGAKFDDLYLESGCSKNRPPLVLTETLRQLIRNLWSYLVSPATFLPGGVDRETVQDYCAGLDEDVKDLCRTVRLLLRASRPIPFGSLDFIVRAIDHPSTVLLVPSRDVVTHCTVETMIPMLFQRCERPDGLKHCCRWIIRKQLNENWQLPHGIYDLPVPLPVQNYLNLLED